MLKALNAANRRHEMVDPVAERINAAFDWGSVDLASVTEENRTQHHDLVWQTATRICESVGMPNPTKSVVTKGAHVIKSRWETQGHLSGTGGTVPLLTGR